jgi:RNA polymerase sigma-70 factor (ECF subfamily)
MLQSSDSASPVNDHGEIAAMVGESSDRRGRAKLLHWIARHRSNAAEAEDLLHEAFLRYELRKRQGPVTNPAGFLLRAAANLAVDEHRKRRHLAPQPFELACQSWPDPAPAIDETLVLRARLKRVWQGLEALGKRTREVFLMHRLEGYKQHEIAAALGISRSAVEKHIAKADSFLTRWAEGW